MGSAVEGRPQAMAVGVVGGGPASGGGEQMGSATKVDMSMTKGNSATTA